MFHIPPFYHHQIGFNKINLSDQKIKKIKSGKNKLADFFDKKIRKYPHFIFKAEIFIFYLLDGLF